MKTILIFLSIISIPFLSHSQLKATETSIVKDSTGMVYPYLIWTKLMQTGKYALASIKQENNSFMLRALTDNEIKRREEAAPKPKESPFFKTGEHFKSFKTKDIDNKKINTKDYAGKVMVFNFWFINCPPCRMEIPELSKLADDYKNDSGVVFLAIALDPAHDIDRFIKTNPFHYRLIDDGRYIAQQYGITGFPTNVVVDKKGNVYFHSSGYGTGTIAWLRKSIEVCKSAE